MFKRFLALTRKDLSLVVRSHYLTVAVAVAIIYVVAVNFLIPAEVSTSSDVVLWDQTGSQAFRQMYETAVAGGEGAAGQIIFVDSQAGYDEAMSVYGNRIGLRVEGGAAPARVVVTYQGHENAGARHLLEAALKEQLAALSGQELPVFQTETLQPGTAASRPPFNLSLLPILIFTEAGMIGLLLAAALLYSEKTEGTLRAYRVSPGRVTEYLLAKGVALGVLGLVSAVIMTLFTLGPGANWPVIVGVVFLSSLVVTLLTVVVANMFQTISQFLFTGIVFNLALALPMVSYFQPSVSPAWFRWLPSYPMIYALREAYFPTGSTAILTGAVGQILLTLAIVLPLAVITFRWQLVRGDV